MLNVYGPSLLTFPPAPVTEVDFEAAGGVYVAGYLNGTPEMVLDNLMIAPVPEPSSAFVFAFGLGTLILLHKLIVERGTSSR